MRAWESLVYLIQKDGHWLFLGHGLTLLGQFVLIKYLAVATSKSLFGQFSIAMLVVAALGALFYGPLVQWALRHYQEFFERKRLGEYFYLILIATFLFVVMAVLLSLFILPILDLYRHGFDVYALVLVIVFSFLSNFNNLLSAILNASSYSKIAAVSYFLGSWVKVFGAVFAIECFDSIISYLLASIIIFQFVLFVMQLMMILLCCDFDKLNKVSKIRKNKRMFLHVRRMNEYLLPFLVWGVPGYVALMGDRWVLAVYENVDVVAEYAAMVFVTFGVSNAIGMALNKASGPIVFRVSGRGSNASRRNDAKNIVNGLTTILIAGYGLMIWLYAMWPVKILELFATSDYATYAKYLWVMMLSASVFNISQYLITHGLVDKRPKIYVVPKLIHGFVILVLLLGLVPFFGVGGAIVGVLIGNVIQLGMIYSVNVRQDKAFRRSHNSE